ncbi:MAG: hypothetical protein COB20_15245 [SAR86 cluster bacterium]|uniref:Uncharacterized protein n=1 Tax=SAR86 cluster bacterium TaxID=2030880 RepID=A0A2A4WWY8_9GAMM|nr:MAG: hypothetical protein COB20_15245 [SAR86 cluster bacterium]
MERPKQLIQPIVYCAVVFITLGIAIANEILVRFGLESNYVIVFSIAFLVAGLLLSKNLILLMFVLAGVFAFNLPDATLVQYHLDRDVLLAMVCGTLLVPSVYQLIVN